MLRITKQCIDVSIVVSCTCTVNRVTHDNRYFLCVCGGEHVRRHCHPDITRMYMAWKVPVQLPSEAHNFEKCS